MPSRTVQGLEMHHWQDTWYTSNGRYEVATEGRTVTTCARPHLTRNGMMCPGQISHMHTVWWVWDSMERIYPMGHKSYDTFPQAVGSLKLFLEARGR